MAEKNIKGRIVLKHDIAENWAKATSFVPKQGEAIIYDADESYSYERIKIGDGVTNVNALPFADDTKVDKISGKGLSTNDYTTDEKNKLAGIATGANKTTVDSSLSTSSTNPVQNKVVTAEINNLSTLVGDTSVSSQITTAIANKVDKVSGKDLSTNDYTTTEKNKLAGIASGAEVNQNAFSNIVVGSTTIAADAKTDTLTLVAGSNVTLTPDATNDKVTIAATDTVYSHPTYTAKSSGLYKVTVDGTGHVSGTTAVAKSDITALGIPAQDTTYSVATTSASGLMSSSDKSKLDGIATGANKTVVDSALSSTSTNPVQNKVINAAISNLNTLVGDTSVSEQITTAISSKSDIGHTHTASEVGADASGSAASALSSAKSYTDTKISDLINGAPTTLDTLGEIAAAMEDNADVVAALETAIGTKANTTDLTSHTGNKSNPHGVTVSQIGAVPTSRTVNSKALSANITLTASDVGADASGAASSALATAKAYTDSEIAEWVGDSTVAEQISTAIAGKSDSGHTHSNYASTVNTTGTGNAITAISQSGNTITATKGSTFLTAHPTITKSTDSTSTVSPAHGGTFTAVDSITRDSNGHVAKVNTKTITLPADNNTDTKVTQTVTTSNASYPLLLAPSGQASTATTTSYFDSGVTLNPSTNTIAANVSGNAATATKATSDGSGNNIVNTYATKTALSAVETLVGDTAVSTQISEAIANKSDVGHTHSAYVNQNAFSNVVVGSTTVAADSTTDTLTLVAGSNVTLTPDATNDKITIAATDTIYTHPSYTARTGVPTANQTPAFGGTFTVSQPVSDSTGHVTAVNSRTITIPSTAATTSTAGLMSATDKAKLDGIATGANKITVDTALSSTSTNPVQNKVVNTAISNLNTLVGDTAVSQQISDAIDDCVTGLSISGKTITYTKGDGTTGTITTQDTNTTYSAATSSALGLVKIGYTESGKNYPVELNSSSQMYVNVPWTDNNTTYTAGTGISLSGTTFSNSGVRSVATGSTNGTISVNTNGTSVDVAVKGLGSAAYTASTAYDASGAASTALTSAKAYTDSEITEWVGDTTVSTQISSAVAKKADLANGQYAVTASSSDGVTYTATVTGITALTSGVSFIIIPGRVSASTTPTLNVNGLGAKYIKRRLSNLGTGVQAGYTATWLAANLPFRVTYDGTQWIVEGQNKPVGADIYGTVAKATSDGNGNVITDTYATIAALQALLPKVTSITLGTTWNGTASPYYQDVTLSCCTETSVVDLQPTPEQLISWQNDGIAFTTMSNAGSVRVYAVGGAPTEAITVQVKVQEVVVI